MNDDLRCTCGHDIAWHHEARGCGYHGFSSDRCPCLLTAETSLLDLITRIRTSAYEAGRSNGYVAGFEAGDARARKVLGGAS